MAVGNAGCSLLVSFNDRGDSGCEDGLCGATSRPDVTMRSERDALLDVLVSSEVGDCAELGEGSACGKPTACAMASTCQSGACIPQPLPDMTSCGTAPDKCHLEPACIGGVCQPPALAANGTTCGTAPDECHTAPKCSMGTCGTPANAAAGTACGKAPDDCHDAPKCSAGVCETPVALPEGTNWKTTDSNARCCGGSAVETTTVENCGVCGWSCAAGQTCGAIDGEYLCTGCTAASECASSCCSESPAPNHCSPSNCASACQSPDVCTGGSHCVVGANIDYCSY